MRSWWIPAALTLTLAPSALAQEFPEEVLPTDASAYEEALATLRAGPDGCWEVVGEAMWDWDFGHQGASRGTAIFVGQLEDGVWNDIVVRSLGEILTRKGWAPARVYGHDELEFFPIVGERRDDLAPGNVRASILTTVLDQLTQGVSSAWSEWDAAHEGVVLHRVLTMDGGKELEQEVFFPEGGLEPELFYLSFPTSFSLPDRKLFKVRGLEARIRTAMVDGELYPDAESYSFEGSWLGLKMSGAQTIRYESFRPCGGAVEKENAPLMP